MDNFLEVVGMLIVIVAMLVVLVLIMDAPSSPGSVLIGSLIWAAPTVIGGFVLAAFGSMLSQLKVIRYASEKQCYLLDQIARR